MAIPTDALNVEIVACERCPRLRAWCQKVAQEKRRQFADDDYWGLPVPNLGDPEATGLIVGLAPAAHGANRTGRMFTGDRSGEWLFRALHAAGLANQAEAVSRNDGLRLLGVLVTACCHCAPPQNKPTPDEFEACSEWLAATLALRPWRAYLCLGGIAWRRLHAQLGARPAAFVHGAESRLPSGALALASYHPSQQNTFTGRLTAAMLESVCHRFAQELTN